jgi:hypothetical protein
MALLIARGLVPDARARTLYVEGNPIPAIIIRSMRPARPRQPLVRYLPLLCRPGERVTIKLWTTQLLG